MARTWPAGQGPVRSRDRLAARWAGATGRAGSATQSDQEPTYSAAGMPYDRQRQHLMRRGHPGSRSTPRYSPPRPDWGRGRRARAAHRVAAIRDTGPSFIPGRHPAGAGADPEPGEPGPQRTRVQETPVRADVLAGGRADRGRDVPGDRIDGFHLTPVALRSPGVQQHALAGYPGRPVRVQQRQMTRPGRERAGSRGRGRPALDWLVRGQPGLVPAVQDLHLLVPEIAQQPPGAGRRGRVVLVVGHHVPVIADADTAHGRLERGHVRQRVPPAGAGRGREIAVQVNEMRARQVALAETLVPGRPAEPPAHIQQDRRSAGRQRGGQRRGTDGCIHRFTLSAVLGVNTQILPGSALRPGSFCG